MQLLGGGFDGCDEFQIVFDPLQRRQEQVQPAFPRFGAERGAGQPVGGLIDLRWPIFNQRRRALALQLPGVRQRREILVRIVGVNERILRRLHPRL
ncbi:hypothetical protein D3C72_1826240 [compost metagenome]